MHRYTPVLAKWSGFKKIGEKVVTHQARKYGVSKFVISRFVNGPLDLASIMFVGKYGKRPMHFFGLLGSIFFIIGIGLSIFLVIKKFVDPESTLTDKPGILYCTYYNNIGVQLFFQVLLVNLISRNAPEEILISLKRRSEFNEQSHHHRPGHPLRED
jgi:ABC-type antimicrobial peptide transport system permease subunit